VLPLSAIGREPSGQSRLNGLLDTLKSTKFGVGYLRREYSLNVGGNCGDNIVVGVRYYHPGVVKAVRGIQSIQEAVMMAPKLLVACVVLALSSCAANVPKPVTTRNSALTHGNVKMNLKVGETTQAEVLEVFGAPNITTIDASGREVWTYQRHATVAQSSSGKNYWTIFLAGGSQSASGFEQSSRTITLIIKFDENDIVSDFRSRSSDF